MGSSIKRLISILTCLSLLSGCLSAPSSGRSGVASDSSKESFNGEGGSGQGSGPTDGGIDSDGSITLSEAKVELRHLVDPFDGSYKTKVTIPKNYRGKLYISGLNVASLKDRFIKAKFNFGRELESVTLEGTIGRVEGAGITPQTDVELVILDADSAPFDDIRLHYDLFDYNDYRDGTGTETGDVISDARDSQLYCRGLKLEHDPTFEGGSTNTACDTAGEKCHYAYAKVLDAGLYNTSNLSLIPTEPQINTEGNGYTSESDASALKKCLPDNNNLANFNAVLNASEVALSYGITTLTLDSANYVYNGPYRVSNESSWEISGGALFSAVNATTEATGLFQQSFAGNAESGFQSFLFPRAGKMDLSAGTQHFSSSGAFDTSRSLSTLLASGDTDYMDGCNIRVNNYDDFTNEGISSCNVTATVELIATDLSGNEETVTTSMELKLQLIRPSLTDYEGKEVLYTSMKTCSSSQSCGSSECCFNNRCWSKELVSQCVEDVEGDSNLNIGETCSSDLQCSSFCCDAGTNVCSPHINTELQEVLCSKSPGQTCLTKEYCRKENIPQCFIVKTSIDPDTGQQLCNLRCYNIPTFGNCRDGVCEPPTAPPVPEFDENNPDCSEAIDPPNL